MHNANTVVCFGEVLWDLLPTGKVAGGAPMNVAFHLNNFGVRSTMISRIGKDDFGQELKTFLESKQINTTLIQLDDRTPTGTVNVTLDADGHPSYEIVQPVAWDFIASTRETEAAVQQADAFVFGSLAARNQISREALMSLLQTTSYAVFDVNLRPPFYSRPLLEKLLHQANLVKMNDDELDEISSWYTDSKEEQNKLNVVRSQFNIEAVLMTKGAEGAIFLDDTGFYHQGGTKVQVKDTIGSGDSFLAGFLSQKLKGKSPNQSLEFACATGALVATRSGGTPNIDEQAVQALIQ